MQQKGPAVNLRQCLDAAHDVFGTEAAFGAVLVGGLVHPIVLMEVFFGDLVPAFLLAVPGDERVAYDGLDPGLEVGAPGKTFVVFKDAV